MEKSIGNIIKDLENFQTFTFSNYLYLVKKYNKSNVLNAIKYLLENCDENKKDDLISKYYIIFITMDIDNKSLNDEDYINLFEKYGEEKVIEYFKDLLKLSRDKPKLERNYAFIYEYIEQNEEAKLHEESYNDITLINSFKYNDLVTIYLKEIGNYPLLTAEEEKVLFERLAYYKNAITLGVIDRNRLYFNDIDSVLLSIRNYKQIKLLNKFKNYISDNDKEKVIGFINLWRDYRKKYNADPSFSVIKKYLNTTDDYNKIGKIKNLDEQFDFIGRYFDAKEKIITSNLRLVVSIAKFYSQHSSLEATLLDYCNEGNIGLMVAADKFDLDKNCKFSTYASWWIKQAITRHIANDNSAIRVPIHTQEVLSKLRRIKKNIRDKTGREATAEELAKELSIDEEKIKEFERIDNDYNIVSIDMPVAGEDNESTLKEFIPSKEDLPNDIVEKIALREEITKALAELTDKEREIILRRFGFIDGKIYTLEEIGNMMGITRERVRQIEMKSLRKLKKPTRSKYVIDFYKQ